MEIVEKKISNTLNKNLMDDARESLRDKWGLAIRHISLNWIIFSIISAIPLLGLIVGGPFVLGIHKFSLSFIRKNSSNKQIDNSESDTVYVANSSYLDYGFKRFGIAVGTYVLSSVFIFLWSLLLIVPGIIATYSYSMVWFIHSDNDNLGPLEALERSKIMMQGYKWKLFCLHLRFIGWYFLSILSLGIGFLWLAPYVTVSMSNFYQDVLDHDKAIENS